MRELVRCSRWEGLHKKFEPGIKSIRGFFLFPDNPAFSLELAAGSGSLASPIFGSQRGEKQGFARIMTAASGLLVESLG